MIIVRLLSPEAAGWISTTNFTQAWEPTLSWNQYRSKSSSLGKSQIVPSTILYPRIMVPIPRDRTDLVPGQAVELACAEHSGDARSALSVFESFL